LSGARIASLHLYPVKGARGLALEAASAAVTGLSNGLVSDREWMAVDAAGRFLTQREVPLLARIVPSVDDDRLVLRFDTRARLDIDLCHAEAPPRDVVVWRSHVRGHDAGEGAARWLSSVLGRDARLVRFDRSKPRPCNPEYAGDSGAHTLFADGYPVLVIGAASLHDLNARLARKGVAALPMNRFRPNVVLDGLEAYDEDHLDTITAGGAVLKLVKPCTRCQVTTTDQDTAQVGIEPLPTLASYRHDARLSGVAFGMNAIVVRSGPLRVGDPVEVAYRF
jgi:uncharacterized protein YcbX